MMTNDRTLPTGRVLDAMEARFPELPRSLLALTLETHWPRTDAAEAAMERLRQTYSAVPHAEDSSR